MANETDQVVGSLHLLIGTEDLISGVKFLYYTVQLLETADKIDGRNSRHGS